MDLETFRQQWVGRSVVVVDRKHPHYKETGEVTAVEQTIAGWAMKIRNDDNSSVFYNSEFYIFRGNQIKTI
jgi:hypothetical protein